MVPNLGAIRRAPKPSSERWGPHPKMCVAGFTNGGFVSMALTMSRHLNRRSRALTLMLVLVGTLLVSPAAAPAATVLTAEVENFATDAVGKTPVPDSRASAGYALAMFQAGRTWRTVTPSSAVGTLVVRARSEECDGAPIIAVSIDGGPAIRKAITNNNFKNYTLDVRVSGGSHVLSITFENDYMKSSTCDRNLYLDKVTLTDVNASTSPTASPSPSPTASPSPSPTVTPSPSPTVTPSPSPTVTPSPSPTVTPSPGEPAGVTLRDVDGGVGYYGRFASPLPSGADFFPIGTWGSYDLTQANVSSDKAAGVNMYVWTGSTSDNSNLVNVRSAGMYAIHSVDDQAAFSSRGSESVGWMLADEIDMQQANAAGAVTARQTLASKRARVPDGRAVYNNYGKGVAFWNSDSDAEQYVNDFQDLVSMDVYWHTDPGGACTQWEGGALMDYSRALTEQECRRSSNYGWNVDRLRELDAMDGQRKPIWNFVELGCPFSNGDCITPDQVRSAVWHSIIAGARGVVYFNHSFGGSCQTHHVLRSSCYTAIRSMVTSVDAQIKQLATVINSPFADGYASSGSGVRVMAKKGPDGYYVFAGSTQAASQTAAIAVKTGTSATVLGENRSVPIVGGLISDTFADSNAIHIYKINP